ncbi:hypothetical protein Tco_0384735 [Tanacetum coccineum]
MSHQKHHLGLHLNSHPLLHHLQVHLELQELMALLDRLNCHLLLHQLELKPYVSSIPKDLHMDADLAPDEQVHSSDDEDIRNDHIPKVNLKQDWWKPLSEEDRPATPEPAWSIPSSDLPVPMNN